jgi:hypothetical protein
MSLSGNLKTVSFPDMLQLLATGKKTGVLEVTTATRQKEVAFKGGNIIFASSTNSHEDRLGATLLRRGKISKTDLDRAVTLHQQTGRPLGTTLIDMNLFSKQEITESLELQVEEIVYNLFSWREGDFAFREGEKPDNMPFELNLNTMNVMMEGTRRIDEWLEIQNVLPEDNAKLMVVLAPKVRDQEITLSLDDFRILALVDGHNTVAELIRISPLGEFVTCRSLQKLLKSNLIETNGVGETVEADGEGEEEIILAIIFTLYNSCFRKIQQVAQNYLGDGTDLFSSFAAQFRSGLMNFFPGFDPDSESKPSFDKFLGTVQALPPETRYHTLMSTLDMMLGEQLEYIYQILGVGPFKQAYNQVKMEISDPLAQRRELVRRYGLEEGFYRTLKRSGKLVKLMRGCD